MKFLGMFVHSFDCALNEILFENIAKVLNFCCKKSFCIYMITAVVTVLKLSWFDSPYNETSFVRHRDDAAW